MRACVWLGAEGSGDLGDFAVVFARACVPLLDGRHAVGHDTALANAEPGLTSSPTARLQLAIDTAIEAGDVLLKHFGTKLSIETKSNTIDLVTTADRAAEGVVLARLSAGEPDYAILAEESGRREGKQGAPQWVVDPLDGTTNFAHRYPHYSVSIGLIEDGVPVLGVVHDPNRGETFYAERGGGAWLHTAGARGGPEPVRTHVTETTALSHAVLATGFGYDRATAQRNNVAEFSRVIAKVRGIRRAGSAALDLAWVAAGRLDGYWEFGLAPWDWCGGAVLVQEAGGIVETIDGGPWSLDAPSCCVGSASMVGTMLGALRQ